MTVEELIIELEKLDKNLFVTVRYRDEDGCYYGIDSELYLEIDDNKLIL